jgi:hypothetical protein
MALTTCFDCGKSISPRAASCIHCGSADPYGSKRGEEKAQFILVLIAIGFALLIGGLAYLGWLMPILNSLGKLVAK